MKSRRPVRSITSKWVKTIVLNQSPHLRAYVPATRLLSKSNLLSMLTNYKMVYVKPVSGSAGHGVMKVEMLQTPKGKIYRYQQGTTPRHFTNYAALYHSIAKTKLKRSYLIQKGIPLLKYDQRPFDIRIMVQKNRKREWEASGYIGRVAHPKKIVTNFHNSGKALALEVLLGRFLQGKRRRQCIAGLNLLGCRIGKHLNRNYPGFREIGVDVGLDRSLKPWIIEVNTAPDPFIFNQLKDKRMFRKVFHYARLNGRFLRKK